MDAASAQLKTSLLDAVKAIYPEHVFKFPEEQSKSCARFLKLFLDTNGSIYSTNYDLLLYWVLMRNSVVKHVNGCGREPLDPSDEIVPPEEQEWSDLTWGKHLDKQNVHYLRGALPFFDSVVSVPKEDVYNYLLQKDQCTDG